VGQEPDEGEERSAALAAEDREGGGAPVSSAWGEVGNAPLPWLGYSKGEVDKVRDVVAGLWTWCSGRWCDGESARPWGSVRRRWRLGALPWIWRGREREQRWK
jgi:hypothetical protein